MSPYEQDFVESDFEGGYDDEQARGRGYTPRIQPHDVVLALACVALGAGLMFLLDPMGGGRRRALIRDKAIHYRRQARDAARGAAVHARDQARGFAAEARARFAHEEVSDDQLAARVRSELGRAVAHPASVQVTAQDGVVTLAGPVLAHELDSLLSTMRKVRGVREVRSQLDVHESAGSVPGLQG